MGAAPGPPIWPGIVDRRGHVVAGEPGRPGSLHRAERERPDVPVRVLEGAGAEIHDRRRRGAGQHRIREVTPLGVRACLVVRGPLPAVGPLSVTCLVQLPGVGGVLDRPAIVLRGPGAQSGGLRLPAVVLEADPLRLVVALVAPPLGGFRLGGPLRRVPVVGVDRWHDRIAEHHLDGDRRPAPGGMVGWARLPCRGARWHGGSAHHRRCDRLAVRRAWGTEGDRRCRAGGGRRWWRAGRRRPRDRASGGGVRRTAGRDTGGRSAARLKGPGRRCGHRRKPRIGAHRRERRISSHRRKRRVGRDGVCRARHLRQRPIRRRRRLGRAQRAVGGVHVGHRTH